ncbi:hypothetical protein [Archaeoglobus profundus]|uniref:Uncharacterized protein n=1 Tax=Archaeoglobus profundus (strain DSM 5631 / JCM 9629 / NBRC 100127 / Av18) TaxID=572546 RepID=D2RFW1_ARCPA|nr:hypothetical protein [Archaeoglobus profundus]ADB57186.1 conserved hypothetical protein [Archaeoglobus profundus DSM 5631]
MDAPFDGRFKTVKTRYHVTMVLPFLLADKGLTAEEIEFVIERFERCPIRLDRLKLLFESNGRRRRWKVDNLSLDVLKEIKRLREEKGYGYQKISKEIYKKFGIYISGMTVRQVFKESIDQIIEEKEKEAKRIVEIETLVEEGKIKEISLKDLVWFAMRKENEKVNAEIERRLNELVEKSYSMTVLDVL